MPSYRFCPPAVDQQLSQVTSGEVSDITFRLGTRAPRGLFVKSNNGRFFGTFDNIRVATFSLFAVDKGGAEVVYQNYTIDVQPKPTLVVVKSSNKTTESADGCAELATNATRVEYTGLVYRGESYLLCAPSINYSASQTTHGSTSKLAFTLASDAPGTVFVKTNNGQVFGKFIDKSDQVVFSLNLVDAGGAEVEFVKYRFDVADRFVCNPGSVVSKDKKRCDLTPSCETFAPGCQCSHDRLVSYVDVECRSFVSASMFVQLPNQTTTVRLVTQDKRNASRFMASAHLKRSSWVDKNGDASPHGPNIVFDARSLAQAAALESSSFSTDMVVQIEPPDQSICNFEESELQANIVVCPAVAGSRAAAATAANRTNASTIMSTVAVQLQNITRQLTCCTGLLCSRQQPCVSSRQPSSSGSCVENPCGAGEFATPDGKECRQCDRGGFYSSLPGAAIGSHSHCACQQCQNGTFSERAGASDPVTECRVCPSGTQTDRPADYRACRCLSGFSRTNRFGPCENCGELVGVNCSEDVRIPLPGFFWAFSKPEKMEEYQNFARELMRSHDYDRNVAVYAGVLPESYRCPNERHCLGGAEATCLTGTTGPLCAICDDGHFLLNGDCFECPTRWASIVSAVMIVLFLTIVLCGVIYLNAHGIRVQIGAEYALDLHEKMYASGTVSPCFTVL